MDNFSKYIDNIVEKALNEALESRADQIVSEIAKKVEATEKLHGKQTQLDKNKNNKIDAEDFKLLRKKGKKSESKEDKSKKSYANLLTDIANKKDSE